MSILDEGRFFKSIAIHLVELELHGSYYFVAFVSSILAEPTALLPSRILSPKALLHSFDTHQGVQRKRNALYSNDNIQFVSQTHEKIAALRDWLVMLAVLHILKNENTLQL